MEEKRRRSREILEGGPLRHVARRFPRNLVKGGILLAGGMFASGGLSLTGVNPEILWILPLSTVAFAGFLGALDYATTSMASRMDPTKEADRLIRGWRRTTAPWWPAVVATAGMVLGVFSVLLDAWAEDTAVDAASMALSMAGSTVFFLLIHRYFVHIHPLAGVEDAPDPLPPGSEESASP